MAADDDAIVIVDDPAFEQLIERDAELVKIGEGYQFSEGAGLEPARAGALLQRHPGRRPLALDRRERGMQLAAAPTFKGNGLAFDVDGSLLVCEQVSRCPRSDPLGRTP